MNVNNIERYLSIIGIKIIIFKYLLFQKISYTEVKSNSTNASIGNNIKIDAKSVLKSVQEKNRFAQFLKRLLVATWVTAKSVPLAAIAVFFPLVLTLVCTAKQCKMEMPKTLPKPEIFYHQKSYLIASGFLALSLVFSLIPIGKIVKTHTGARVRCNGKVIFIIIISSISI